MDMLTLETSVKQYCVVSENLLIPMYGECDKGSDDVGTQHLNIEKDAQESSESKNTVNEINGDSDNEACDDLGNIQHTGRYCYSDEESDNENGTTEIHSGEVAFMGEEEMWDDDSDDYWDPTVRDVSWSVPSTAFSCYNPSTIDTTPLSVAEGQFDDPTEENS